MGAPMLPAEGPRKRRKGGRGVSEKEGQGRQRGGGFETGNKRATEGAGGLTTEIKIDRASH